MSEINAESLGYEGPLITRCIGYRSLESPGKISGFRQVKRINLGDFEGLGLFFAKPGHGSMKVLIFVYPQEDQYYISVYYCCSICENPREEIEIILRELGVV